MLPSPSRCRMLSDSPLQASNIQEISQVVCLVVCEGVQNCAIGTQGVERLLAWLGEKYLVTRGTHITFKYCNEKRN
ncbi:hypothetical protein DPMN_061212 [Dreissena polymorpha]|uniref:Uncharacterized protein n=1 Tax=Dreissena polymorpha TaxID=45954 RepID=A0A9D4C7F2_DREPO|nr:hypothetical protein DPMN_061212 [Dreissena polymorpha]